ncbi:MAG: dihydrofolate reductase [Myxococcota bacterium]|nr:dihydrofolate reductase [Myxococcota bacterium]
MTLSLVVAVAESGVIGRDGDLPWRLPDDLKHFRRATLGKTVIMGRKTWESLPSGPLKKRLNVVVTRQRGYAAEGALVVSSLREALAAEGDEKVIIGGASLYEEALPLVDTLHVTHVEADVEGDTFFPDVDWSGWEAVDETRHEADARHAHPFRVVTYRRRRA